ncbi:MAG: hypothetical protein Q4B45_00475 [Coriobacteriia bacterium]|nr:hypothetical protein [Coriobacteriia bacterium]
MKPRFTVVCSLFLAIVVSFGLCACKSEADKVTEALRPTLESYVEQDDDDKKEEAPDPDYGDSETASVLEAYGLDADKLHELCFARYSFEIGDVSVADDGTSASVAVSITNVSLASAATNAASDYEAYQSSDEAQSAYAENGHKALLQHLFDLLCAHLQSDDTVTTEVTLSLTKNEGGEWTFDKSDNAAFYNALYGGSNVLGGLAAAVE